MKYLEYYNIFMKFMQVVHIQLYIFNCTYSTVHIRKSTYSFFVLCLFNNTIIVENNIYADNINMKKKINALIICIIILLSLIFSSVTAFKWNFFKPSVVLDLYTYDYDIFEFYQNISHRFSTVHPNIMLNIILKADETPVIGIKIDEDGLPIFKSSKNAMLPINFVGIGLAYNKEIFTKHNLCIPKTFREMENVCKILHENSIVPFDTIPENLPKAFIQFVKANTKPHLKDKTVAFKFVNLNEYSSNAEKFYNFGFMNIPISNDISKNTLYADVNAAIAVFSDSHDILKNASNVFIKWLNTSGNI